MLPRHPHLQNTHAAADMKTLLCIRTHHTDFRYTVNHIIQTHIKPIVIVIIVIVIVITCDWSAIRWFSVCYRLVVESVAGWFRVWSICVKAQLHVQSFMSLPTPDTRPLPPFFACLTFFFFHHWLSVWGWEGPLGSVRGFNTKVRAGSRSSVH